MTIEFNPLTLIKKKKKKTQKKIYLFDEQLIEFNKSLLQAIGS